jgi:hypothetical protein
MIVFKSYLALVAGLLLLAFLFLAPLGPVQAAEDPEAAEQTTEEVNPRGPGAVILMLGLGAIVLVGGAYVGTPGRAEAPKE